MITARKLIELLKTLDKDDKLYAYEGEVTGLVTENGKRHIKCSEYNDEQEEQQTELTKPPSER